MRKICISPESRSIFEDFKCKRLLSIQLLKYPNVSAYNYAILNFANEEPVVISCVVHDILPKWEVNSLNAGNHVPLLDWQFGVDSIALADFEVTRFQIIERLETFSTIGFEDYEEADVEVGINIFGSDGSQLKFEADAFPLLFTFCYSLGTFSLR